MGKENTIEDNFNNIEEIISKMESEDITLEDSFDLYSKGLKFVKDCNEKIEKVEKQMKIIEGEYKDE